LARRIGLILAPSRAGVDHPGSRLERIIRKKRPPQPGGATAKVGGRTPGREKPEGRPAKAIIFHARSGPAAALRIRFPRWPGKGLAARAKAHQPRSWSRGGASDKDGRSISGGFHQLKPLRSHRPKDGPRFAIGRRLCQLQAMGGEGDILLAFFDRLVCHLPRSRYHDRDAGLFNNL